MHAAGLAFEGVPMNLIQSQAQLGHSSLATPQRLRDAACVFPRSTPTRQGPQPHAIISHDREVFGPVVMTCERRDGSRVVRVGPRAV